MGCGTAEAASHAGAAPHSLTAQIKHDEGVVAARYHHCASLHLSPRHCPFKVATTADGHGGTLIAVDLTQQTMDDCDRGRDFFFTGETLRASTRALQPHSLGGVESLRAHGTAAIAVSYGVNRSASTSCAQSGNAGTDTYVYGWNGKHMVRKSGTPPRKPKVIVGT
ncbi:MAG: hypothetical protein ACR2FU_01600 [Streptosporangiaceae bacterium]